MDRVPPIRVPIPLSNISNFNNSVKYQPIATPQHDCDLQCVGNFIFLVMKIKQLGMASAVQTVCGQAYGVKKYGAMGIICQRAIVLHLGAAVLITFLYAFSGQFLKLIGQSESIAEQGRIFAHGLIPQLYAFAMSCPTQRFLQA